jgi:hypothetical protein
MRKCLIILPGMVLGWSDAGHHFAASVANSVMKHSTRSWVHSQIGGMDFETSLKAASVWADHDGQSIETDEFHFVHTPYRECLPYVGERDCGFGGSGKCLVTGIEKYLQEALAEATPPADRTIAVKMLIHLIADMYQPLHTGFAKDHGGNDIGLANTDEHGEGMSLHGYWDRELTRDMHSDIESLVARKAIYDRSSVNRDDLAESLNTHEGVSAWLASTVSLNSMTHTCGFAYKHITGEWIDDGSILDDAYRVAGKRRAVDLLVDAGVVLGVLMDYIAGVWESRKAAEVAVAAELSSAAEAESERTRQLREGASKNPFTHFTIDEFEFDPEEVVLQSAAPPKHVKRSKKERGHNFGVNLAKVGVRLLQRPLGLLITSRARAEEIARLGYSSGEVATYSVGFVRNSGPHRTVVFSVDRQAFPGDSAVDPEFVLRLIYQLKGRKYSGKTIVPNGSHEPTVDNIPGPLDNVYPKAAAETTPMESYFGVQLRVSLLPPGRLRIGVPGSVDLPSTDITKFNIISNLAASLFPSLSRHEGLQEFTDRVIIPRRCSDVVLYDQREGVALLTSKAALVVSARMPGSPIRAWGANAQIDPYGIRLLLIDLNLLEVIVSPGSLDFLIGCAKQHAGVNVPMDLRPTIDRELDELLSVVTETTRERGTLADDVFIYDDPRSTHASIVVIEWKLI